MKILGHPVHIMLIHFPSALFPMDFVCSVLYFYAGEPPFAYAAFYALAGGVLLGWLAAVFGLFDLVKVSSGHPAALKKALVHGGINFVVITVYTLFAYAVFKNYPQLPVVSPLLLLVKAGLLACLVVGNYLGGSLVLKDKVAVEN